jgi:hypothetical protein
MINFQIGQCRITVDESKTKSFYSIQPKVTELCDCPACVYYAQTVINKPVKVYEILSKMGVDLTKYDKDEIEGIYHTGEREKFKNSYLVHYKIFGQIGKTQRKSGHTNEKGLFVVDFFDNEEDSFTKYSWTQVSDDTIEVRIEIECDRK